MKTFDKAYVYRVLDNLLKTDSPSGFTGACLKKIARFSEELGLSFETTNKGAGIITVQGKQPQTVALCAHFDTLGLMVRSIKANGTLAFTRIGSPNLATLDGEYCKIYTREGKLYTGTILCNNSSAHVFKDASELARDEKNMHVKLDSVVKNKNDVERLGISAGDFICIDTKTQITDTDFIKSRFLDDKLSVAIIFGVLKYLIDNGEVPTYTLKVILTAYEEVGHGMSFIPEGITEVLAVDMGCVGDDLNGSEFTVSICAKDSGGPYDFELTNLLIALAKEKGVRHAVDVFPLYSSDISAVWKGGHDVRGALIGPGVASSHGMERSHFEAVNNTMMLIYSYLTRQLI